MFWKTTVGLLLLSLPLFAFTGGGFEAIEAGTNEDSTATELGDSTLAIDTAVLPLFEIDTAILDYYAEAGVAFDSCNYYPLYETANEWMGVRYRYAGRTKKGVDCSSLVKNLYLEAYQLELEGTSRGLFAQCEEKTQDELQEGDFVFFKINKSHISHIGLYLRDGYFVHASVSRGVMINNLNESYYKRYFFVGGRLQGNTVTPEIQ